MLRMNLSLKVTVVKTRGKHIEGLSQTGICSARILFWSKMTEVILFRKKIHDNLYLNEHFLKHRYMGAVWGYMGRFSICWLNIITTEGDIMNKKH